MPEWVKTKIREALLGKTKSAEHRANLWKNRNGWTHSEESKRKISESLLEAYANGEKVSLSGWKHSAESKVKMSVAGRGKPKTPEHRGNISRAVKEYWRKKKCLKSN